MRALQTKCTRCAETFFIAAPKEKRAVCPWCCEPALILLVIGVVR